MLVDRRPVDHAADRDELLTLGVRRGLTPVTNSVPCAISPRGPRLRIKRGPRTRTNAPMISSSTANSHMTPW